MKHKRSEAFQFYDVFYYCWLYTKCDPRKYDHRAVPQNDQHRFVNRNTDEAIEFTLFTINRIALCTVHYARTEPTGTEIETLYDVPYVCVVCAAVQLKKIKMNDIRGSG